MHYYTAVGCIRDFIDFINDDVEKRAPKYDYGLANIANAGWESP